MEMSEEQAQALQELQAQNAEHDRMLAETQNVRREQVAQANQRLEELKRMAAEGSSE